MYHAHFRGTHYEAGFRWGSLLLKHKNIILENIPFEITQERIDYALSCLPIYEKYYHEIMEEIQGLADGQQCDVRILQAVLFSMYSMPPSCNCSCFAFTTEHEILLGRNSDFLTEIERLNQNVVYKLTDGVYSFTGNTTAFVEIEDGVNEHGLAVGLTSVYPNQCKPGFNAGMIVRYLLEKCKNVSEAVSCLYQLPIASAQTLTLADAMGTITVIECNAEQIKVEKTLNNNLSFVCATNTFHFPEMIGYNNDKIDNWFAEERYQTLYSAFNRKNGGFNLPFAEKLLSGDYGFLCQYDRSIRLDFLEQVVLYEVKRLACFASEYENDFIKAMIGRSAKVAENTALRKQRELDALTARDRELDMLFERLYEDNVAGKIDDARFAKMSKRYEQEQGENAKKIKALRLELKKDESKRMDIDDFLETVRRYTDAATITKRMVAELIDHIEVYHAEKQDGITNQRVVIHYNCIGAFDVPDRRKIPEADIIMETRKGVALSYAPEQVAV